MVHWNLETQERGGERHFDEWFGGLGENGDRLRRVGSGGKGGGFGLKWQQRQWMTDEEGIRGERTCWERIGGAGERCKMKKKNSRADTKGMYERRAKRSRREMR